MTFYCQIDKEPLRICGKSFSHRFTKGKHALRVRAKDKAGNLADKQVEFAQTIYSSGSDLLSLINDILDLSKIESGTVTVEPAELSFATLLDSVARPFRHDAEARKLTFDVRVDPKLGRTFTTDQKRLQQVLKNLLSNAFKFTDHGGVRHGR